MRRKSARKNLLRRSRSKATNVSEYGSARKSRRSDKLRPQGRLALEHPQIKVYSVGTRNYFLGILFLVIMFLVIFLFFSASIVLMILFGLLVIIGGFFYWVFDMFRRKS